MAKIKKLIIIGLAFMSIGAFPCGQAFADENTSRANNSKIYRNQYIVGPGDLLEIDVVGIPEMKDRVQVGPDNTIYLPGLRVLDVGGLTLNELRFFVTQQLKTLVKDPEVFVRVIRYRPVRVYVGGEVERPGYYILGSFGSGDKTTLQKLEDDTPVANDSSNYVGWPSLFDAIKASQGVTPFSDLQEVFVTRKSPGSLGGEESQSKDRFSKINHSRG